jgi:signal transduction histidine kinase
MGTGWVVKVRDNGIGIAPAYHEQIFGLFKRLHQRSVPDTGIGLAICKKIVDGMGGHIRVESELGQGSTFWFTVQSAPQS